MSKAKSSRLLIATAILGLTISGCAGLSVIASIMGSSPWTLAGGDGRQLIYATTNTDDDTAQLSNQNSTTQDIYSLNTETLETTKIASNVTTPSVVNSSLTPQFASNGRHVAWADATEPNVVVLDTDSSNQQQFDLLGNGYGDGLFILDGRLIVNRNVDTEYEVSVVDLESSQRTDVSDSWYYGGFALIGNTLVLRNDKDTNVDILALELSANIEMVDLTTGERNWIVRNLRVPGDGGALFGIGSSIVWCDYPSGSFDLRIRIYDLESGQLDTITENANPDDGSARLCGATNDTILLEMTAGNPLLGENMWLELMSFDGQTETIADLGNTAQATWSYTPSPRLVDGLVVWTDPIEGSIETYNIETKAQQSFEPTTE